MHMRRLIFLGIDGPLAGPIDWNHRRDDDKMARFQTDAMGYLNNLVQRAGAEIVITSSWRRSNLTYIRDIFARRGFFRPEAIIGETIRAHEHINNGTYLLIPKGVEIKAWLDVHVHDKGRKPQELGKDFLYVIIDGGADMLLEQAPFLVQSKDYFTLVHYLRAREILNT